MKINLTFAELHTPLFLGGVNFGLKLYDKGQKKVEMVYDQVEKELWVTHDKSTAIIPTSNVVSMTPEKLQSVPAEPQSPQVQVGRPAKFKVNSSAQVSTPTSHVFGDGPGHK